MAAQIEANEDAFGANENENEANEDDIGANENENEENEDEIGAIENENEENEHEIAMNENENEEYEEEDSSVESQEISVTDQQNIDAFEAKESGERNRVFVVFRATVKDGITSNDTKRREFAKSFGMTQQICDHQFKRAHHVLLAELAPSELNAVQYFQEKEDRKSKYLVSLMHRLDEGKLADKIKNGSIKKNEEEKIEKFRRKKKNDWTGYEIVNMWKLKKPVECPLKSSNPCIPLGGKVVHSILRQIPQGFELANRMRRCIAMSLDSYPLKATWFGLKKIEWRSQSYKLLRAHEEVLFSC